MHFPTTTVDLEWGALTHTIISEDSIISDTIHTVLTIMVLIHTVLSIPTEVMVTILMATALADWDGEVTVMEMDGTETEMVGMEMAVDGEAQTEAVKHPMLHTIIADQPVSDLGILQPTDVAFFKRI
jgi:hypothetical protein